jgi:hypothetical protein
MFYELHSEKIRQFLWNIFVIIIILKKIDCLLPRKLEHT